MSVWTSWLSDLAQEGPVGLFLYAGCDHPDILKGLPLEEMGTVVLANCNPALQEDLADLDNRLGNLQTRPVAITGAGSHATLYATSLPGLSGLAEPKAVFELFPNLQLVETCEVAAIRLAALLADLPDTPGAQRLMRAELSGGEKMFLEALFALPGDTAPDHVFLRIPDAGLYAQSGPAPALEKMLASSEYELVSRSEADPDFPEYWLRRDRQKIEQRRLAEAQKAAEEEMGSLKHQLAEAKKAAEEEAGSLKHQLAEAKKAAEEETGSLKHQLAEAKKAAEEEAGSLKHQLAEAKKAAEEETGSLKHQLAEAKKAAEEEAGSLKHQLAEAKKAVEAQQAARSTAETALKAAQDKLQNTEALLEYKTARVVELGRALGDHENRLHREIRLNEELAEQVSAHHEAQTTLQAQHDARLAERDQLEMRLAENEAAAAVRIAEMQALVETQAGQLESIAKDLEAGKAHGNALEQAAAAREEENAREIDRLKAELAHSHHIQDHMSSHAQQMEARLAASEETVSDRIARTQQEIDTALRLQAMARADVADLRQRYEAVLAERATQDSLIQEMVTQLQALLPATRKSRAPKAPARKKPATRRSAGEKANG